MANEVLFEARHMHKAFGPTIALKDVDFTLRRGEIRGLIGENGSGKSTLLRAISGFMRYSGSLMIGKVECRSLSSKERARQVALLPQILPQANITVRTLTEHGRYPHHGSIRRMSAHDEEVMENALEITGLKGIEDKLLGELSGGERQRAFLAMVIAQDTPMILLDEPTSHMDLVYQREFYELLEVLRDSGKGIVMVCHSIDMSLYYSDRIMVMHEGEEIFFSTPFELIEEKIILKKLFDYPDILQISLRN